MLLQTIPAYIDRTGLATGSFSVSDFPGAARGIWTLESNLSEISAFQVSESADVGLIKPSVTPGNRALGRNASDREADLVMDFPRRMIPGEVSSFRAGVVDSIQPSRLYIYSKQQLVDVINIQAGVENLSFTPRTSHEGGLSFELEWVKNHKLYNERVFVEVPWVSQQLALALEPEPDESLKHGGRPVSLRLTGGASQNISKAQVLVDWYDPRQSDKATAASLSGLYPQYKALGNTVNGQGWQPIAVAMRPVNCQCRTLLIVTITYSQASRHLLFH